MNFAELADPEFWRQLLSSDFNRGYAAAIGLVFALLLLLLALKIIFKLLFRTRRCGAIPVRCPTGDLVVSRGAIENAARQVLDEFPQLAVRRIIDVRIPLIYIASTAVFTAIFYADSGYAGEYVWTYLLGGG